MLYNQLEWILQPYFLSRWWDSLAWIDNIQTYINMAIQDVYNENNWIFKIVPETISTFTILNWKKIFKALYNIDMFIEANVQDWNSLYPMTTLIKDWQCFNKEWQYIYFLESSLVTSIDITYTKEYIWYERVIDWWKIIPVPNKFIPAIMKSIYDYTSPINLFDWEQTQVDFFGHYTNRINKLKDIDSLSEITQFIPYNTYYG